MKQRNVPSEKTPSRIICDLSENFVNTMFLRFEFARGALQSVDASSGFCESRPDCPPQFHRLKSRKKFLPTSEAETTYLEDLRADLNDSGEHESKAREALKCYVESNMSPLCPGTSITVSPHQEPFFPLCGNFEPYVGHEAGPWVREYTFQLFELQDFLLRDIGVRRGSLLPVWVVQDSDDSLPIISCLPVRQNTIQTLVRYVAWEYGGWAVEDDRTGSVGDGRSATKVHVQFLLRALRWARIRVEREVARDDIEERLGEDFGMYNSSSIQERECFEKSLYPGLDPIPKTISEETLRELIRTGEKDDYDADPAENAKNCAPSKDESSRWDIAKLGKHGSDESALVNDSLIRQEVRKAVARGQALYHGAYRGLW